jgi:two-component system response regulator DegU
LEADLRTRILIADDHPIFRSGLKAELSRHTDFEIVGEAVDGDEVIAKVNEAQLDVVILDISMPGIKAADVIKRLGKSHPAIKVLVLTAHGDKGTITSMLKAGAHGYILKEEESICSPRSDSFCYQRQELGRPFRSNLDDGKVSRYSIRNEFRCSDRKRV